MIQQMFIIKKKKTEWFDVILWGHLTSQIIT